MKKVDFVRLIAEKADMTQKDVSAVLEAFDTVMLEDIFAKEDSIRLGIGTFSGFTKPATAERNGRNPSTGENIVIPAKPARKGYPKVKWSSVAKA